MYTSASAINLWWYNPGEKLFQYQMLYSTVHLPTYSSLSPLSVHNSQMHRVNWNYHNFSALKHTKNKTILHDITTLRWKGNKASTKGKDKKEGQLKS